ncbi:fimbria/pilus outer membrane usher protein [Achromobacter seleniivolatilans]|uniref:Fimbria/pilus outer membrane usher protein n=1 Tax=Achromobacter seleniivolatilans TaxID=3047478 RepID=A0ABY9LVQ9_9BURK|nr:fimbria/pilus outer membrane usher protein [Achromobacter sp. R39]WMD18510.1 fimbria/pilus outer membrane usher protein [Achromobacter sp. R39]
MLLFSGAATWAATPAAVTVADVEFDDTFLQKSGGSPIDISRFSKGNGASAGNYRSEIYVNDAWLGRADVMLRAAGNDPRNVQPCFDRSLLERIGVDLSKLTPQASERLQDQGAACMVLSELIPDATASFDNGEQRLDVSLPQIVMSRQARDYVDPKYWDDGITAARLQYNANAYRNEGQGFSSTQAYVGLNAGVNIGSWRFRHSGSLTHNDQTGSRYQSMQTNLQRSIAPIKSQLVIGDAFTDGTMFDSVGFRGVQLASDDRMFPESQRGYAPTIRGIANSNARVQVRQNGNVIYETTVAAGAFEINDLYPTGYGGDLEVVVTEADGSVHVSKMPYAAAVNALRPGVTRYTVTAGKYRNATVRSTPEMLQATVQHGFTNLVTGYGGVTAAQGYAAAVAGAALNTDFGAFGLDVTHATTKLSTEPDRSGQSVRLSYSKLVAPTNTNLTLAAYRYSTSGFLSQSDAVALRDAEQRNGASSVRSIQRGRLQMTVNQGLPAGYGSVYLSGSTQDYWNRGGRDTQYQVGYNNSYKRVNYGVSAARQFNVGTSSWENRVMLNIGIPLGKSPQAPYSMTSLQSSSSGGATVNEAVTGSLGTDNAVSYGMNAGRSVGGNAGSNTSLGANAAYVSPVATLSASASKANKYTQASAGISGGVVAYNGGVAFAPSMSDTVAIVEAKDAAGARLTNSSGLRVDPWGHAVVSNLTPFARNQIEIDPKGLPLSVELKSTLQQVAPTSGAVVKMKFDTENAGRVAIIQAKTVDGKPLPFGAEVFNGEGQPVGTVGQGGRILARGLNSGSGALTVSLSSEKAQQCKIEYQLPELKSGNAVDLPLIEATCQ